MRNVLIMELAAGILLFVLSFLQNYEMLYKNLGLTGILRYDLFLIIAFSAFQLVYVNSLFLDWYFSYFEITDQEIIKKTGILFRRRKSIGLSNITSIEIYQSPLSRIMKHSTIILHYNENRVIKIKNIADADEYLHIIKQTIRNASGKLPAGNMIDLIKNGESLSVEFKESLRYDTRKGEISREIERAVLKTIVAFLNTNGGTLLIGVKDNGEIVGLERDFESLPKKNRDGFENHLNMLLKTTIGMLFVKYINVKFERTENKDVCLVLVEGSHKPAYLRNGDKKEDFFVRVGNATQPLSMSEAGEYIKNHWQ